MNPETTSGQPPLKSMIIVGYGPGLSHAAAEKFGRQGFAVALVARNAEKLDSAVEGLRAIGVTAMACPADAEDPVALRAAIQTAREALGPVSLVLWNVMSGLAVGNILAAPADDLRRMFESPIVGLLDIVGDVIGDMQDRGDAAILVTNGSIKDLDEAMDAFIVDHDLDGLSLTNAVKSKAVGLIATRLAAHGIYVGEVTIGARISPEPGGDGEHVIHPRAIAEELWARYAARAPLRTRIP